MYTLTYWDDLATWKRIADSCLKVGGNRILGSRFHALQQMIDWRLTLPHMNEDKHHPTMETLSRVCAFASQSQVTASEKVVFLHIFISICEAELEGRPTHTTAEVSRWEEALDGVDFDEPYPPEDDPNNLVPPTDIDSIPF